MDVFPGLKVSDKIVETEFNGILLNSIQNRSSDQAYVQGFYCENRLFLNIYIFECMEIAETIYEDAVEPSY